MRECQCNCANFKLSLSPQTAHRTPQPPRPAQYPLLRSYKHCSTSRSKQSIRSSPSVHLNTHHEALSCAGLCYAGYVCTFPSLTSTHSSRKRFGRPRSNHRAVVASSVPPRRRRPPFIRRQCGCRYPAGRRTMPRHQRPLFPRHGYPAWTHWRAHGPSRHHLA